MVRTLYSIATAQPDLATHRKADLRESRPLGAVPAQGSDTPARTVVRVDLRPSEWGLVLQQPGLPVRRPAPRPSGLFVPPLPGRFAFIRVSEPVDPRLGVAVLLYQRGHTLICSSGQYITERAACVLSVLAGRALDLVLRTSQDASAANPDLRMAVTRIEHSLLPEDDRHVASASACGGNIEFRVCSSLITADLADAVGLLCTAHAKDLFHLSREAGALGSPGGAGTVRRGSLALIQGAAD
jgi:hypothetical protein